MKDDMTDRAKAFAKWWSLSINNSTLPELREQLAREAYYAAWGDGSQFEAADEIERLREELHYCNGTCDLAMKHRDIAEAKLRALTGREGRE